MCKEGGLVNIVFFTQYFPNPNQPGGSRAWMLAKYFGSLEHELKVVCSQGDYTTGNAYKNENNDENLNNSLPHVSVHKVPTILLGKSFIGRILQYLSFAFFALIKGLSFQNNDVILASSPPIFVGLVGLITAKIKGCKFVLEIRDPWPDALIHFEVVKSKIVIKLLYQLEKYLNSKADLIVALTPGIKRILLEKGVPEDKVIVITNGYDPEIFEDKVDNEEQMTGDICTETEKTRQTKIIYIGSLGNINETEMLMDVVIRLADEPEIVFQFIGSGNKKEEMMATAMKKKLTNIEFLPSVPKKAIALYLRASDIAIVATHPGLYSQIGLHNKLFDYLGSYLPVVASGEGDLAKLINDAHGGIVVKPRDVMAMVKAIKYLHNNPDEARTMGEDGRNHVAKFYNRFLLLQEYEKAVSKLVFKEDRKDESKKVSFCKKTF